LIEENRVLQSGQFNDDMGAICSMDFEGEKTPLFEEHVRLGGKMAPFAGWLLPLWYPDGQSVEHHAVRRACGLFDICHMGEFDIEGPGSLEFLSGLLTNRVAAMHDGQAMYNLMLNDSGGVIDDCILYRFSEDRWLLVVNAANIDPDWDWMKSHAPSSVRLANLSDRTAKLDLQGLASPKIMAKWIDPAKLAELKFFHFLSDVSIDGMKVLVSRTGYTGEIGFELFTDISNAVPLWKIIIDAGAKPCGLGSRDTLRLEAGLPLHGHELRPDRPALGHPWIFAVNWEHAFIGRDALEKRGDHPDYFVVPFQVEGLRKAMSGWEVLSGGQVIGVVLSGVNAPSLDNAPIGFAGINRPLEIGASLSFRQGGRPGELSGKTIQPPFVKGTSRRAMADFL
jgi:aminomethyltransferase